MSKQNLLSVESVIFLVTKSIFLLMKVKVREEGRRRKQIQYHKQQTNRRQTDRWKDIQMDGQTAKQMNKQTNKQTQNDLTWAFFKT